MISHAKTPLQTVGSYPLHVERTSRTWKKRKGNFHKIRLKSEARSKLVDRVQSGIEVNLRKVRRRTWVGCGLWVVGCGLWVVGCGMWDMGYEVWGLLIMGGAPFFSLFFPPVEARDARARSLERRKRGGKAKTQRRRRGLAGSNTLNLSIWAKSIRPAE